MEYITYLIILLIIDTYIYLNHLYMYVIIQYNFWISLIFISMMINGILLMLDQTGCL